jgi:hypothetical protein
MTEALDGSLSVLARRAARFVAPLGSLTTLDGNRTVGVTIALC